MVADFAKGGDCSYADFFIDELAAQAARLDTILASYYNENVNDYCVLCTPMVGAGFVIFGMGGFPTLVTCADAAGVGSCMLTRVAQNLFFIVGVIGVIFWMFGQAKVVWSRNDGAATRSHARGQRSPYPRKALGI